MSRFVIVAVPVPTRRTFTYRLPETLDAGDPVGRRVLVPFGPRRMTGLVVALADGPPPVEAKDVLDVLDEGPILEGPLFELTRWIADYYLAPWGETLRAALPVGRMRRSRRVATATGGGEDPAGEPFLRELEDAIRGKGGAPVEALVKRFGSRGKVEGGLARLESLGRAEVRAVLEPGPAADRTESWVEILPEGAAEGAEEKLRKNAIRQIECLLHLRAKRRARRAEMRARFGGAADALVGKGFARIVEEEMVRIAEGGALPSRYDPDRPLTPEQEAALAPLLPAIRERRFEAHLLHGITGSGKTEVYLRAASETRAAGRTVLALVPEIALTPQTVGRFRARFGDEVVVLHSALSPGERHDTWREIRRGHFPVVVGVRSALFAPLRNLGLIVVDEEHDTSYKQGESPRYHGRDMAVVRAKLEGVPILLGSATPSVESIWNVRDGKYRLAVLPKRIHDRPLPRIEVVDLARVPYKERIGALSPRLVERIGETLGRGEQAMLFLNRRGYAPFLHCPDCGHVPRCAHCEVAFTFHRVESVLRCHYCGVEKEPPTVCPECGGARIGYRGMGTQRVEEDLRGAFPSARIGRMDLDTTRKRDSARRILSDFAGGGIDLLLGTQMIAKGHHFPGVSLVGVILADTALHLPDFRAGERTFQLLLQVAGRAGRGDREGEVVIQTFHPRHYCIRAAIHHDFDAFVERELADRRELRYPPFSRIVALTFRGKREGSVRGAAARFRGALSSDGRITPMIHEILGPTPAPITKIRDRFRWRLMIKAKTERWRAFREVLAAHLDAFHGRRGGGRAEVVVDVDAQDLL
ncbi:MAG: primosomal protein N' [Candidatus Eisenbacteria bacterium]|nr:primosomal protein N' [Candidatus Eisenbacteria bacterium]